MRKWVWVAVAFIFTTLLLTWLGHRARVPFMEVQKELARLRQLGEPTKLSDLLPPVPANQDGTSLYRYAIIQLKMAERKLPKSVLDSIYEFIKRQPIEPFSLTDVQKVLRETQPALQTLRKALNYSHMRMTDWGVEDPMNVMFPHFSKFREFARLLVAEGKWRKREGDIDGAIESHLTALKLVRRMGDEPSLVIGFLVQGAIFTITFDGLQQVLSDADASQQSYRALLAELMAWDIDRDFVRTIQSERIFVVAACDWMSRKASLKLLTEQLNAAIWLRSKNTLIARNELKLLKHYEAVLNLARKGVPYDWKKLKELESQWQREVDRPVKKLNLGGAELVWDENFVARLLMPAMSEIFKKAANFHAFQRITQVSIALRLYRHEHGRYPETLQELVPKYLPYVPIDPFDGKSLRYKRLKSGFKIWSVGQDFKDDGGVEKKPRWVEGDIVWETVN